MGLIVRVLWRAWQIMQPKTINYYYSFSLYKCGIKISLFLVIWNWRELLPTQIHLVERCLMWQQKLRRSLTQKSLSTELQRVYSRTHPKVVLARWGQSQWAFPHSHWQNRKKGLQQRLKENLHQIHAILRWCYSVLIGILS